MTSPEQSKPDGEAPPHTYGTPRYCSAIATAWPPSVLDGGTGMLPPVPPTLPPLAAAAAAVPAPSRRGRRSRLLTRLLLVDQVLDVGADLRLARLQRVQACLHVLLGRQLRLLIPGQLRRLGRELAGGVGEQLLGLGDLRDQVAVLVVGPLQHLHVVDQLGERVRREQERHDVLVVGLVGAGQALRQQPLGVRQILAGHRQHDPVVLQPVARLQIVLVDGVVLLDLLLERRLLAHDLVLDLMRLGSLRRDAGCGGCLRQRHHQEGGQEREGQEQRSGHTHTRCACRATAKPHGRRRYQTGSTTALIHEMFTNGMEGSSALSQCGRYRAQSHVRKRGRGMRMRRMWALAAGPLVVVLLAAGCGGSSSSGGSSGSSLPKGSGQVISIPVSESGFSFTKTTATANAGVITLQSKNPQSVSHDISIKGTGVSQQGNEVSDGGTSTVTVTVTPGTYVFYCSVPGHEQAGMKGVLTVS